MRQFRTSLLSAILLLQAPMQAPTVPPEEPETTCAATAAQIAFAPEPATEAITVRLTFWQRFQVYRARTAHQRRVHIVPAAK